jgi:hypothetical protein
VKGSFGVWLRKRLAVPVEKGALNAHISRGNWVKLENIFEIRSRDSAVLAHPWADHDAVERIGNRCLCDVFFRGFNFRAVLVRKVRQPSFDNVIEPE